MAMFAFCINDDADDIYMADAGIEPDSFTAGIFKSKEDAIKYGETLGYVHYHSDLSISHKWMCSTSGSVEQVFALLIDEQWYSECQPSKFAGIFTKYQAEKWLEEHEFELKNGTWEKRTSETLLTARFEES